MSSTNSKTRVRFAPSPTGLLHVGGIRSALFNWLWARHNGGVFVLRIEDTDRNRLVEGALDQIIGSLDALGITPDEGPNHDGRHGPYIQSQRQDIYHREAAKLLKSGALYRCWCSPERLDKLRAEAQANKTAFKYDRHCLDPKNHKSESEPHVLRFKIPEQYKNATGSGIAVTWNDAVRDELSFLLEELDDFVAIKADGYPTYHFANVVDDHLMEITHVLRADEWIPSTPKHLLLFQAFGWQAPIYAHLPAVQGPKGGKKLSKRDGAQPVEEYIDEGYLPEALRSFLASLGWNDGTTDEVYDTDTLIKRFTLERVQKSPARFDKEHLTWVNGVFIRRMPLEELYDRSEAFWPPAAAKQSRTYNLRVLELVQERLKFLAELPELTDFFYVEPKEETVLASMPLHRVEKSDAIKWLEAAIQEIEDYHPRDQDFKAGEIERTFRTDLAQKLNIEKIGPVFMVLRVSVTGKTATPGLFETMEALGRDITLKRLRSTLDALNR